MSQIVTSFYSGEELNNFDFKSIGNDCKISRKASFHGTQNISIGNNVRVDDFCILSSNIILSLNIHISAYMALYGAEEIKLEDYTGMSPRCMIYSAMDDFSGDFLIGPIHPEEYIDVTGGKALVKKYSQIGANSVIFPNLTISEGVVVGACSMVKQNLALWGIYAGILVRKLKDRAMSMLKFVIEKKSSRGKITFFYNRRVAA